MYVKDGERVIGFDNECGKGDHRHRSGKEQPYEFAGLARLIEDFIAELGLVERTARSGVQCPYADIHVDMHMRQAVA